MHTHANSLDFIKWMFENSKLFSLKNVDKQSPKLFYTTQNFTQICWNWIEKIKCSTHTTIYFKRLFLINSKKSSYFNIINKQSERVERSKRNIEQEILVRETTDIERKRNSLGFIKKFFKKINR